MTQTYTVATYWDADDLMDQLTNKRYTYGAADTYPEPYAVIAADGWSDCLGYRIWRCQGGIRIDLIAEIHVEPTFFRQGSPA